MEESIRTLSYAGRISEPPPVTENGNFRHSVPFAVSLIHLCHCQPFVTLTALNVLARPGVRIFSTCPSAPLPVTRCLEPPLATGSRVLHLRL
ncbi:hypothetical protein E2C01_024100 [Portunus trituberculatus]|uniref:Uncharacterized protein n=1 Tax=Portunus trituberculatus TaxID=210409 RepID=A0A5B7E9P2_PORTR|nr:hypothetical protein [Portunus trituberculatus]